MYCVILDASAHGDYNMSQLIPSTAPGMAWSIYVNKPDGRPPYAFAMEVTPTGNGNYSCVPTEARNMRVNLDGRNTINNRRKAVSTLLEGMVSNGWLTPEAAASYDVA